MKSTTILDSILSDLKFTENEREAFLELTKATREYMKDPNADIEKSFREIVEKVVSDEIQKNKI